MGVFQRIFGQVDHDLLQADLVTEYTLWQGSKFFETPEL